MKTSYWHSGYDVTKLVVIQCDARGEGLGATLLQEVRPITSASRALSKRAEKNYVALELECLALWHESSRRN